MLAQLLADNWRVLSFRKPSPAMGSDWRSYLAYGLVVTWLAGIGRYWDNPRAGPLQHLGLGSLAYVLVLGGFLWLLIAPLRPARWSFRQVLLFLTLCSPPALLYAIPVERFMGMDQAQSINAWFLAVVAFWRMALLFVFLVRGAGLSLAETFVATLLPVTLIVVALSALNLEHVVFSIMAGTSPNKESPADTSYLVVWLLSIVSIYAAPVLLVWYSVLVYLARTRRKARVGEM